MKNQALIILACAASLFAQDKISCEISFDAVKNTYPRDASADRIYASVNARIKELKDVKVEKRNGEVYETELKNCNLAVELFKIQLSKIALQKGLDSIKQENLATQKKISAIKDSLIDLWISDAKGARALNATLNDERNRLERLNRENAQKDSIEKARLAEIAQKDSIEKARLAEELAKKEKALAEKDSLLAKQKAEADKKLEALRSKTINVYKDARGTILSMSGILFETGKSDLTQELRENLAEVAAILKNLLTESAVVIEGHTDNVGKEQDNKLLSQQRATSVLNYLVERGVDKNRLKAVGYGSTKPVADNKTEEGKAKNRRVELVIKD